MAVLFRQSMLINGILCNSELLYGLNKTHIEKLESVDVYLWRNVFSSMVITPIESYFIETNTTPIRYILMARRLMYYWTLLNKDDSELAKKRDKIVGNYLFLPFCKHTLKNNTRNNTTQTLL